MGIRHKIRTKTGTETITLTPMRAIRKNCLECVGWSAKEVELCTVELCAFYLYRFGKKPDQKGKRMQKEGAAENNELDGL